MKKRGPRWLVAVTVAALCLIGGVVFRGTWEVHNTTTVTTTFATEELEQQLRVVQVSDFHNIDDRAQVASIVEQVAQAKPDLIAITGDIINTNNGSLDSVAQLLEGLAATGAPRYFVDGNHDHWSPQYDDMHALLQRYAVTFLRNESTVITGDFGTVHLIGVDDYYTGHGDLGKAVAELPESGFRLVLTHSPEILPELDRFGVDYAMCGHTHGGQIRLPIIGAIYQPGGQWFPKVSKGAYREGNSVLYVDSGIGVSGPKLRLLNQSQITLHVIGT